MSNQQPYKLTQGTHTTIQEERRVRIEPGAVFVPSEEELKAFGDRLEKLHEVASQTNMDEPLNDSGSEHEGVETPPEEGGQVDTDEEWPKHTGSGWYELPNGEKIQGKEKADEQYKALLEEQRG